MPWRIFLNRPGPKVFSEATEKVRACLALHANMRPLMPPPALEEAAL